MCVPMKPCMCCSMHVEIREQLLDVSSLILPCWSKVFLFLLHRVLHVGWTVSVQIAPVSIAHKTPGLQVPVTSSSFLLWVLKWSGLLQQTILQADPSCQTLFKNVDGLLWLRIKFRLLTVAREALHELALSVPAALCPIIISAVHHALAAVFPAVTLEPLLYHMCLRYCSSHTSFTPPNHFQTGHRPGTKPVETLSLKPPQYAYAFSFLECTFYIFL